MAAPRLSSLEGGEESHAGHEHAFGLAGLLDRRFAIAYFSFRLPDTVTWSPQMYTLTGRAPQAAPLGLADLVEPFDGEDRLRFAEMVGKCLRQRTGDQLILTVSRPDGTRCRVEVAADVVLDGEQLLGLNGLLRESFGPVGEAPTGGDLERASALVKAMPIPAVLTDTEMHVLAHSSLWARSHGVTTHDIIGADLISIVPKAPVGWALEHAKAVAGQTIAGERMFHSPVTGRPVRCMANLSPWYGEDGTVTGVVTMVGWSDLVYATKEVAAAMKGRR